MATVLETIVQHNLWANLTLLETCAGLSDEQLEASAPGTYGSIRETLAHLVAAEERYLALLTGQPPEQTAAEDDGVAEIPRLIARARRSGEGLIALAARADSLAELQGVSLRRGEAYRMAPAVPFLQAINHATEHRAHVITILSQLGVRWPEIDGWAFAANEDLVSWRPR